MPRNTFTRCRGFTLMELMVVLVLMGIILSMMTISVGDGGQYRALEEEANRLKTLIEMARDESVMRSQDWIIAIKEDGYQFEIEKIVEEKGVRKKKRHPIKDRIFRERKLPDYRLTLMLENEHFAASLLTDDGTDAEEDIIGRVYIYSSGEMSEEFEITMEHENGDDKLTLKGNQFGELSLKSSRDESI